MEFKLVFMLFSLLYYSYAEKDKRIFATVVVRAISSQVISSICWSNRAIYVSTDQKGGQVLYFLNKDRMLLNNVMNNYGERI